MRDGKHTFAKNKMCQTNLIFISHRIIGLVGKGQAGDVIYFDFSRRNCCRWIEDCLKNYNRWMLLIFHCQKKACSECVIIKSGWHQPEKYCKHLKNAEGKKSTEKKVIMQLHRKNYMENAMALQNNRKVSKVLQKYKINWGWVKSIAGHYIWSFTWWLLLKKDQMWYFVSNDLRWKSLYSEKGHIFDKSAYLLFKNLQLLFIKTWVSTLQNIPLFWPTNKLFPLLII